MLSGSKEFNDKESQFLTDLNGHEITAAFSLTTDSGAEVLHLFANRSFCRMEISDEEWLSFCQIQDISEWVDCNGGSTGKTQSPTQSPTQRTTQKEDPDGLDIIWVLITILSVITIGVILTICYFVYLIIDVWKRVKKLSETSGKVKGSPQTSSGVDKSKPLNTKEDNLKSKVFSGTERSTKGN